MENESLMYVLFNGLNIQLSMNFLKYFFNIKIFKYFRDSIELFEMFHNCHLILKLSELLFHP